MDGYDVLVKELRKKERAPRTNFQPSSIFHFPLFSHVAEQARKIATNHPGPYLKRVYNEDDLRLENKNLQNRLITLREGYKTLQELSPQSGELKEMADALSDQETIAAQREAQVGALDFSASKIAKLYTREKIKQPNSSNYKSYYQLRAGGGDKAAFLEHLRHDFRHDTNDLYSDLKSI